MIARQRANVLYPRNRVYAYCVARHSCQSYQIYRLYMANNVDRTAINHLLLELILQGWLAPIDLGQSGDDLFGSSLILVQGLLQQG